MPALVRLGILIAVTAVAVVLAFHEGGYFITSWGIASIVVWALLAACLVTLRPGLGGWPGLVALGGLVGLALWQGVSAAWANEPAAAVGAMNQTLLYAGVVGLGLAVVDGPVRLRQALWSALAGIAVVAAGGVGARLFPDRIDGDDFSRLNTPISYWNGLGALFAVGVVVAIGLAGAQTGRFWARGLALGAVPLLSLGLYLTLSRGAILVMGLALAALVALAPGRLETVFALAVGGLAALVPIVMAARRDLTSLGGEPLPTALEPRRDVALALILCTLAAGAAGALGFLGSRRVTGSPRRVAGAAVAAVVIVAAVGGYVTRGPEEGPVSWADTQFESFKSFGTGERNDDSVSGQLATAAGTGRWQNWTVAWDQFRSAEVAGTGAGDYRFWWNEERPVTLFVVNAHSLYLEVMGESGLVGLLLLLLPLGTAVLVIGLVLVRRLDPPLRRDLVVAGGAAGVIAVHAMGDWDWQLPAVMLPALLLGAAAIAAGSTALGWNRANGLAGAVAGVVGALVVVLLVAGPLSGQALVDQARAEARSGDLEAALSAARDAEDADPASPTPRLLQAYVLTDLGRGAEADQAFAAALERSPRDWAIMADWAGSLIARREYEAARPLVTRASALNPREPRMESLRTVLAERSGRTRSER